MINGKGKVEPNPGEPVLQNIFSGQAEQRN